MLDTSNYSKIAVKVTKSSEAFAAGAHLCARAKWFCVATARTELQAPRWIPQNAANWWPTILSVWTAHPSSLESEEWDVSEQWFTPSISKSQGRHESPPRAVSLPSHWTQSSWGLSLTQLMWGEIKPILRNPERPDLRSSPVCTVWLQKQTLRSTASQRETDPAPDEPGE